MKRAFFLLLALALILGEVRLSAAVATTPAPISKAPPGVAMADAISTITGVAISPLLGTSAIGAWKYYNASVSQRSQLPWFAQPWFWAPALTIVFICALKDVFGIAFPAILKKPFDVLETMEHKISGLVAAGAFVPFVAAVFTSVGADTPASFNAASLNGHGFLAAIHPAWLYNTLAIASLLVIFLIVFLASNAINILILLSPFPLVDAALKAFRFSLVAIITLSALLNPWLGLFFSVVIIAVAYFIAGWSLRLSHFGLVFVWEFCTGSSNRFTPQAAANSMFLGRTIDNVPIRTYGKLSRDNQGNLVFHYRRWLVLPERRLILPAGIYAVGHGLLYSEIVKVEGTQLRSVLLLPPRYRSHESALAATYSLDGVREAGLRAMVSWFKEWLGLKPRPQLAIV